LSTAPEAKTPRSARVTLALSIVTYLAYSSFGIAAPFWWGHHGYHGATYMLRARMSLRFHMLAPATWTGYDPPPLNAYYFHHPIGYHHLLTLLIPIFGEHEWLARGLAVLGGLLALIAIYVAAKRAWSPQIGALAALAFVTLPIVTSFSVLSDPMMLALACVVWSIDAYLRLYDRPSKRALLEAGLAYAIGGLLMWEAYFIAPFIAFHALWHAMTVRGRALRIGRWNALVLHAAVIALSSTAVMALHFWLTHHARVLDEFFESYRIRHTPPSAQHVLDRHSTWLTLLYGFPPLLVGGAWLTSWITRLIQRRGRPRDLLPLTFFYVNTLYIYMFAEGSSVHLYRVFFYSGFFAFALADLVDAVQRGTFRIWPDLRAIRYAPAFLAFGFYLYHEGGHAYRNLVESRAMMGTHGHIGYQPQQEKMLFAAELTRATKPTERVILHSSVGARKEFWFYCDRAFDEISNLVQLGTLRDTRSKSILAVDTTALSPPDRTIFNRLLAEHPVTYYESLAYVDLRVSKQLVRTLVFEREPSSLLYKWLVSTKYPKMIAVPGVYLPAQCDALSQGVPIQHEGPLPHHVAAQFEVCLHNLAVARAESADKIAAMRELAIDDLKPLSGHLANVNVAGVSLAKGTLRVAYQAEGDLPPKAETADLRYVIRRGTERFELPHATSTPPWRTWKLHYLYVDTVAIPGGAAATPIDVTIEVARQPPWRIPEPLRPVEILGTLDLGRM
jgi:hypothetical protein